MAAVRSTLAHTIMVAGKEKTVIVKGKFGNTTSTFFPAAGAVDPVDGRNRTAVQLTWIAAHDAATGDFASATETGDFVGDRTFNATDFNIARLLVLFTTSTIGTDTITSATFSLANTASAKTDTDASSMHVVASTPSTNSDVVVADFDQFGTTSFGSKTILSWTDTDTTYNDITLNATGIAAIATAGTTKFGVRSGMDMTNTTPTIPGGNRVFVYFADQAGTATDPKLVVVHAGAAGGGKAGSLLLMGAGV